MPLCPTCKAYVNAKGEWAPADQLSQVCTERDKAQREAGELRWSISTMAADLQAARTHRKEELDSMFDRVKLLNYRIDKAIERLTAGDAETARKILRGESVL